MAFTLQHWARGSVSANTTYVLPSNGTAVNANINGGPSIFTYFSSADAQATIATADYFVGVVSDLKLHDVIYASGSDADVWYSVTAVNYDTPAVTISGFSLAGPVGTANITDLAVTTGKLADAAVTTGKLDATTIQYVTGTITAAQFKALYDTPKALVTAPGANKLIVVRAVALELVYGAAQFTAGGVLAAQYDSTVHGAGTAATATVAAATINGAAASSSLQMTGALALAANTTCVNKGIYLSNATANFATGDSTFNFYVWYSIVTTT